jgi:hypothetical protein
MGLTQRRVQPMMTIVVGFLLVLAASVMAFVMPQAGDVESQQGVHAGKFCWRFANFADDGQLNAVVDPVVPGSE